MKRNKTLFNTKTKDPLEYESNYVRDNKLKVNIIGWLAAIAMLVASWFILDLIA